MLLQKVKQKEPDINSDDYYAVLGVDPRATMAQIKKAFRRLAGKYHPDKPTGNKEKFNLIKRAYDVLSDPRGRKQYDKHGRWDEEEKQVAKHSVQAEIDKILDSAVDLSMVDIVGTIKDGIAVAIGLGCALKASYIKKLNQLEKNKARAKDDILLSAFRAKIRSAEQDIKSVEKQLRILAITETIISGCQYDFDQHDFVQYEHGMILKNLNGSGIV